MALKYEKILTCFNSCIMIIFLTRGNLHVDRVVVMLNGLFFFSQTFPTTTLIHLSTDFWFMSGEGR